MEYVANVPWRRRFMDLLFCIARTSCSKALYGYCFAKGKVFIICMPYGILTLLNVYNSLSNIGKLFGEY